MNNRLFSIYTKLFSIGTFSGCHQRPDRSFHYKNWQFPVCARCTGVFIGHMLMLILVLLGFNMPIYFSFLFLAIMFLDWLLQYLKISESNNTRRLITGFISGLAIIDIYRDLILYLIGLF